MRIEVFQSLSEIEHHWREFNFSSSINYDFDTCLSLEKLMLSLATQSKIIVAMESDTVVGIFPMYFIFNEDDDDDLPGQWMSFDYFFIGSRPMCSEEILIKVLPLLPAPYVSRDLFFKFRLPEDIACEFPAQVISLPRTFEEYLYTIRKPDRNEIRRVVKKNADISIEYSENYEEAMALYVEYLRWFDEKHDTSDLLSTLFNKAWFSIFEHARRLGCLMYIGFRLDGVLIAANYAIRKDDCVDDYICVRKVGDSFDERGLGNLAIIENIKYAISLGLQYYDLSAFVMPYKKKFINNDITISGYALFQDFVPEGTIPPYFLNGKLVSV